MNKRWRRGKRWFYAAGQRDKANGRRFPRNANIVEGGRRPVRMIDRLLPGHWPDWAKQAYRNGWNGWGRI